MTKGELVKKLAAANQHLDLQDVAAIVDLIFYRIAASLASGDRVELRGFGSFSVKRRDPRIGRNPRTGDSVEVDVRYIPSFRMGKPLRDRLNRRDREISGPRFI